MLEKDYLLSDVVDSLIVSADNPWDPHDEIILILPITLK